jgi:hypothetical protein
MTPKLTGNPSCKWLNSNFKRKRHSIGGFGFYVSAYFEIKYEISL